MFLDEPEHCQTKQLGTRNKSTLSHISLFTGAGGLDLGLEMAGFDTIAAVEINSYACETLRKNKELACMHAKQFDSWFNENIMSNTTYTRLSKQEIDFLKKRIRNAVGKRKYLSNTSVIEADIRSVNPQALLEIANCEIGEVDLISGGPPCQPFSRAGKRETLDDDRGSLFAEFVRIVAKINPKSFLFENVKGMVQSKADIWFCRCNMCGNDTFPPFSVERRIPDQNEKPLECRSCHSKQTRWIVQEKCPGGSARVIRAEFERLGYQCHEALLEAADFGAPQYRQRWFLVGFREKTTFSFPSPSHSENELSDLFSTEKKKHRTLADAILSDEYNYHGVTKSSKNAVLWVKNVVRPHDEPVTWTVNRPSPTIGAHQGAKLAIAPKGVPEEQLFRQQWHTKGRRQGDTPPVEVEHEYLTDHDLLRLQTFPDDWFLYGTRMERAFQIGNAVPPILAKAVGEAIAKALAKEMHIETHHSQFRKPVTHQNLAGINP
jgi:DNA (cytosine-5)-methyltransferase 1